MEELLLMLQGIQPLSAGLEAHLRARIGVRHFLKGDYLLRTDEVAGDILFLRRGLVGSCRMVGNKPVWNWFMKEGDICISVQSFLRQMPSVDSIIALEDCECWGITHRELEEVYRLHPEFNYHGRIITGEYYCRSEERHDHKHHQTPEYRYAYILQNDPGLLARIPRECLASYLGIGLRKLYYIMKEYSQKGRKSSKDNISR